MKIDNYRFISNYQLPAFFILPMQTNSLSNPLYTAFIPQIQFRGARATHPVFQASSLDDMEDPAEALRKLLGCAIPKDSDEYYQSLTQFLDLIYIEGSDPSTRIYGTRFVPMTPEVFMLVFAQLLRLMVERNEGRSQYQYGLESFVIPRLLGSRSGVYTEGLEIPAELGLVLGALNANTKGLLQRLLTDNQSPFQTRISEILGL